MPSTPLAPCLYFASNYRRRQPTALSIKDPETDRLAREVGALTGDNLNDAVRKALAERLERERLRRGDAPDLAERLDALGRECAALPDFDTRTPNEIVGYDKMGTW